MSAFRNFYRAVLRMGRFLVRKYKEMIAPFYDKFVKATQQFKNPGSPFKNHPNYVTQESLRDIDFDKIDQPDSEKHQQQEVLESLKERLQWELDLTNMHYFDVMKKADPNCCYSISEFEKDVADIEGIKIRILANDDALILKYRYMVAAAGNRLLGEVLMTRLGKFTGPYPFAIHRNTGGYLVMRIVHKELMLGNYNKAENEYYFIKSNTPVLGLYMREYKDIVKNFANLGLAIS